MISGSGNILQTVILWYMSPHCDLHLEDTKTWHSGFLWCITRPRLAAKGQALKRKSSGQTITEIMHLHCDFDLEGNSPVFFHKALKIVTIHYQLSTPKYTAEKGMIFIWGVTVTLTLNKSVVHITLAPGDALLYRLCYRGLSYLKDIVSTKLYDHTDSYALLCPLSVTG